MRENQVGDRMQFTFDIREFILQEVLENPEISMWWTWKSEVCPHCKEKIEKRALHNFFKIEIYIAKDKKIEESALEDIVMIGYALDGKTLQLTKDKLYEAFEKSEKFKHMVKK